MHFVLLGANTSATKTPAMDSLARKVKSQKKYIPEDSDSDPNPSYSLSSDSGFSDDRNYKHIIHDKKKKYRKRKKQEPIKLCSKLTAKFLTTAYELKVLKFKLDEDPLQRRIYFLTFMESLEIIFHGTRILVRYL